MTNRLIRSLISMLIFVTILISMVTAANAESCNIKITLKAHESLGSIGDVKFFFYKVGDVDPSTDMPIFDERYGIGFVPQTAEEIQADIKLIKKADKTPITTGTTSPDGVLEKTLDRGIYYIEAAKNNYGTIEPSLVWLPYYDDINEEYLYSLAIEPKAAKVEGEIATPTTTAVTPGQVKGEVAGETGSQAKTNDSFDYWIYTGILLLSAVMLTTIFLSRKKEKNNDR